MINLAVVLKMMKYRDLGHISFQNRIEMLMEYGQIVFWKDEIVEVDYVSLDHL